MASIPEAERDAYDAECKRRGKRISNHGLLVYGGKINVLNSDIFQGTEIGELAASLLRPAERIFRQANKRERRWLRQAMLFRLREISCADADEMPHI